MTKLYAPSIPLDFDSKYGFKNVQNARELVKFHLTNLLLTHPGEKISDSAYGVGLRGFLFQPLVPDILIDMENKIQEAIGTYLTYLIPNKVSVLGPDQDQNLNENQIRVRIQYVSASIRTSDVLDITLGTESADFGSENFY